MSQEPFKKLTSAAEIISACPKCDHNLVVNESKDNLIKVLNEYVDALKLQVDKQKRREKHKRLQALK